MDTDLDAPVPQDHLLCKIERVTDYDRIYERVSSLNSSAHNAPPSRRTSGSIPASQSAKTGKRHEDPPTNIAQMLVGGLLAFSKQKRVPRRVADTQCGACSTCPHNVARSQRPFAACCWYTARSHRSPQSHRPFSPRHKRQGARPARSRLRDLAPFLCDLYGALSGGSDRFERTLSGFPSRLPCGFFRLFSLGRILAFSNIVPCFTGIALRIGGPALSAFLQLTRGFCRASAHGIFDLLCAVLLRRGLPQERRFLRRYPQCPWRARRSRYRQGRRALFDQGIIKKELPAENEGILPAVTVRRCRPSEHRPLPASSPSSCKNARSSPAAFSPVLQSNSCAPAFPFAAHLR